MPYLNPLLDSLSAQDKRVKALNMEIDSLNKRPAVAAEKDEEYEVPFIPQMYLPQFPGGMEQLDLFLKRNLKYPQAAVDSCIQGKVTVRFNIRTDGSVTNITIAEGFHPDCDAEVMRVIRSMPKWIPTPARGRPLSRLCVLSVIFGLKEV